MNIYGELLFENLAVQDKSFDLQCVLFQKKLIQGIQLRVAHPSFTPGIAETDIPKLLARLPDEMKVFVHYGAENVGNDFGCRLDKKGEFARRNLKSGLLWESWNQQALNWGIAVAKHTARHGHKPLGVAHPGYGFGRHDEKASAHIVDLLINADQGCKLIALENVVPEIDWTLCQGEEAKKMVWTESGYWGFGGTPEDMSRLLDSLNLYGTGSFLCLIDFTHLWIMANQARAKHCNETPSIWADVDLSVRAFMALPHSNVCHFSGLPPVLVNSRRRLRAETNGNIAREIYSHDAVCLEIPFTDLEQSKSDIGWFLGEFLGY